MLVGFCRVEISLWIHHLLRQRRVSCWSRVHLVTTVGQRQRVIDKEKEEEEEEEEQDGGAMIELKAAALPSCNTNISTYSGFNS